MADEKKVRAVAEKVKSVVSQVTASDVRDTVTNMTKDANAFVEEAVGIVDNMHKVFKDIDDKIKGTVKNDAVRMYALPALLIGAGLYWLAKNNQSSK